MNQLRQEQFDLALGETFDSCFYAITEYIGIKNHATILSLALLDMSGNWLGIPSSPSYLPGVVGDMIPPFRYSDRAKNLFFNILSQYLMMKAFLQPTEEVVRPIIRPDFVVEKYEQIMNSSKKGVVLVSFGSVAQSYLMSRAMKKAFLEAFAQFPDVTFLWKYEKDEDNVAAGYKNVITGKWLPQTDLLVHPKLLAFISHGGANSIAEATATGVPIICIPLFADQHRNGLVVKYRKIGVNLNKKEVVEGKLVNALHQVLDDDNPKFGKSHVTFMGKIADILVNAGHDVVVYLPEYNINITTTGTKHARVIERPLDFEIPSSMADMQGIIGDMIPPFSYSDRAKNSFFNILTQYLSMKTFLQPIEEVVRPIIRPDFVVEKYEQIMSSSKKGVVLVSFGSVAQSYLMSREMKKAFLDAFAQFPDVTFLWKYEKDEDNVAAGYKNVITGKWLPQTDLLGERLLESKRKHPRSFSEGGGKKGCRGLKPTINEKEMKGLDLLDPC
uniref:glucuronosyltransferase n=1 Tax=Acrobeloides nanus TaxID=290746 RepID=A0A914D7J9_9BILA